MAYVPGFTQDIFISYAHVDDIPRCEGEQGWVTNFHDALRRHLPGFLGRGELAIWRDERLGGADYYDDVIARAVRESAVMVSVMSVGYFASTYCRRELRAFCDQANLGVELEGGRRSRVFKVLLGPVGEEQQDERVRKTKGYDFYVREGADAGRLFRRTRDGAPDDGYWGAVERLARELAEVLARMAGDPPPGPTPPTGRSVYLAEVTDDLDDVRTQLKEALTQQGVRVLPGQRLPARADALREAAEAALEQSVLSVHLLGALPGKSAEGDDPEPVTQFQYRLASQVGLRTRAPRVVWLPPELSVADVRNDSQREFLERLRYEPESDSPLEVLQKSVEELKEVIFKKLLPPPKLVNKFQIQRKALVYVAHHPDDHAHAAAVRQVLKDAEQDVILPCPNQRSQRQDHRARMRTCDAALILYGSAPVLWARDTTVEARGIAIKRRRNPLYAQAICDGPPDPKDDLNFDFQDWPILACRHGISSEGLAPFIQAIARKG